MKKVIARQIKTRKMLDLSANALGFHMLKSTLSENIGMRFSGVEDDFLMMKHYVLSFRNYIAV